MSGWILVGVLLSLGLWGILHEGLQHAATRWERRRWRRLAWRRAAPTPVSKPKMEIPIPLLGLGAGAAGGLLLGLLGTGGIWPLFMPALGVALGMLARFLQAWSQSIRLQAAEVALLEELALQLTATGSLEAAMRRVAEGPSAWPEEERLRGQMRTALDQAIREGKSGVEAFEVFARQADPQRLLPIAAGLTAAIAGGRRPEETLLSAADEVAWRIASAMAGRLRALPDQLLPVVGLGMFAPILGLVVLPVVAYLIQLLTLSAARFRLP